MAFAALPAALVTLAGCSSHSVGPIQEDSSPLAVAEIDVPEFEGLWADDFAWFYRQTHSDFERALLEDGVITDAEFAEMTTTFESCLQKQNIDFTGYKRDGSYGYQAASGADASSVNDLVSACAQSSGAGTVGMLYFEMMRNPENLGEGELLSTCLVKKEVVPQRYSAEDYYRDAPTGIFPFTDEEKGNEALYECASDPLGLFVDE